MIIVDAFTNDKGDVISLTFETNEAGEMGREKFDLVYRALLDTKGIRVGGYTDEKTFVVDVKVDLKGTLNW
jgi:hypothetical protein